MGQSFALLKDLIGCLQKDEVKALVKKLALASGKEHVRDIKSRKLVDMVLMDGAILEVDALKMMYEDRNKVAFSKLVRRVIDRIDEVYITFDGSLNGFFNERNYYFFFLRRKLLILQMRILKGVTEDLIGQFDRIRLLSRKYEFYEILIDTLRVQQRYYSPNGEKKLVDKIQCEIEKYDRIRILTEESRVLYISLSSKFNRVFTRKDYEKLCVAVEHLSSCYANTGSPSIGYNYFFLRVILEQVHGYYSQAEKTIVTLSQLVKNSVSVYTAARYGDVLISHAENKLYLSEFNLASKMADGVRKYFVAYSEKYFSIFEIKFYSLFYQEELVDAERVIREIYYASKKGMMPLLHSKHVYLYACVKAANRNFQRSSELLLQSRRMDKDKCRWNVSRRVLTIINCIEMRDYENADLKAYSLQKFISRISKHSHVQKRDIIILRILLKLINEGFDFLKVHKQRKRYFDLLESEDPEYRWKILSPELIVFHEWFKKKMLTA